MYKYVMLKLKDIYNYLQNICMSFNFKYVFICHIISFDVFICRLKSNDICIPA